MVFASLTFLYIFLPVHLILYFAWKNKLYRNILLTISSFIFYAWGEPVWIGLLIFTAALDYANGLLIERYFDTKWKKVPLIASIVINLSVLAIFKYSTFIAESINQISGLDIQIPQLTLPIGISFYTFQTISYVLDVFKGEVKAQRSFLKFMLFVSLYHQLVAGPIVRYAHISNEIDHRKVKLSEISDGISRFCIGLFKKIAIANIAGEFVMTYMGSNFTNLTLAEAWFGILMFTIQIYFDFSGYSDMAIGLGEMVGFHYHENFNYPYTAKNAGDFWRRWHISLGTFFRDYVYIPLGGNKRKFIRNLLIVWVLTGLWHGASWNFILWGLFWGILILLERLYLQKIFTKLPNFVSHLYLVFAVFIGWVIFYFVDLNRMIDYMKILFGITKRPWISQEFTTILSTNFYWLILSILLCLPFYPFIKSRIRKSNVLLQSSIPIIRIIFNLLIIIISTSLLVGKTYNPFLYFRF